MRIGPTEIEDTFAEAFGMRYCRLIVTACDGHWLAAATREACGYGTSIIECDAETGVEVPLTTDDSPDGRCAAACLFFGFSGEALAKAVGRRAGQCLMTCPTTAVFDGLPAAADRIDLGCRLRFFGDGFQKSKVIAGRRYWRIPVMDGEFLVEETAGIAKGVAGGNILIQTADQPGGLAALRRAVDAVAPLPGVITPFPGGGVRSGSKVGSRYQGLVASTADAFCPTLMGLAGKVATRLHPAANCCYEIVIDGVSEAAVAAAMRAAIHAAAGEETLRISAGNYGGKLGKFHFHLRKLPP